jgi:hypothetical protein
VEILLSTGPAGAVAVWEDRSYESLEDEIGFGILDDDDETKFYTGFLSHPFESTWTVRNLKPPKDDEPTSKWILDQVNGANDTCP